MDKRAVNVRYVALISHRERRREENGFKKGIPVIKQEILPVIYVEIKAKL